MTVLCIARCVIPRRHRDGCADEHCRGCLVAPAAPGLRLCWHHRNQLGTHLDQLADLAVDLEQALSRSNVVGEERVGGTPGGGQELNDRAAAARWQIHHDMIVTVRLVIHERGFTTGPADDIAPMAEWLSRHVDWLAAHPTAGERSNETASWVSAARNAINPNPSKYVEIGPCVRNDCPGTLTAVVRPQDSLLLPSSIMCSWWKDLTDTERATLTEEGTDPHIWRADQWHALGRQVKARA